MYWVKKIKIDFQNGFSQDYTYLLCDSFEEFIQDTAGVLSAPIQFDAQIGRKPKAEAREIAIKQGTKPLDWKLNPHLSPNVISVMNELGAVVSATEIDFSSGIGDETIGPQIRNIIINKKEKEEFYITKTYIPGYESIFDGTINKKTQKLVKNDPVYSSAYIDIGFSYHINRDYDKAIKNFSYAIKINKNNFVAYYNRGWNYYLKGKYRKAIKDLAYAKKANPSDRYIDKMLDTIKKVYFEYKKGDKNIFVEPKKRHPQMNENYNFDNFTIKESNRFAVNVAIAVSKNPGRAYNPVLIIGNSGAGKTHLLQAIGNYIHNNSYKKVIYIKAETFLNEFIESIQNRKPLEFKEKFRYTDVLLLDDIQFLNDKPVIQTELFHTINTLLGAKKQMVFTCDRYLSELEGVSKELISRFKRGLIVEL